MFKLHYIFINKNTKNNKIYFVAIKIGFKLNILRTLYYKVLSFYYLILNKSKTQILCVAVPYILFQAGLKYTQTVWAKSKDLQSEIDDIIVEERKDPDVRC